MVNYSSATLMGNVTAKPEFRIAQSGTEICVFSIAVNRKDGDDQDVSFFDCKAFGKQAIVVRDYVDKGSPLFVTGRLEQERWEKDGVKRSKVVVIVGVVQLLRGSEAPAEEAPKPRLKPRPPAPSGPVNPEDIPF